MEKNEKKLTNFDSEEWRVGPKAFISLAAAILFFSGIMTGFDGMKWLSAFDFSTLIGKFGTVKTLGKDTFVGTGGLGARGGFMFAKDTFVGTGGLGARGGFMFALSLVPSVMLAIGCLEVLSHYGAIKAAHKLLTPLLRPLLGVPGLTGLALITDLQSTDAGLLGVPGLTGLALITDLQSTDAGAALTKELYDQDLITKKELTIIHGNIPVQDLSTTILLSVLLCFLI